MSKSEPRRCFVLWIPVEVLPLLTALCGADESTIEYAERLIREEAERHGITAPPYEEWEAERLRQAGVRPGVGISSSDVAGTSKRKRREKRETLDDDEPAERPITAKPKIKREVL